MIFLCRKLISSDRTSLLIAFGFTILTDNLQRFSYAVVQWDIQHVNHMSWIDRNSWWRGETMCNTWRQLLRLVLGWNPFWFAMARICQNDVNVMLWSCGVSLSQIASPTDNIWLVIRFISGLFSQIFDPRSFIGKNLEGPNFIAYPSPLDPRTNLDPKP